MFRRNIGGASRNGREESCNMLQGAPLTIAGNDDLDHLTKVPRILGGAYVWAYCRVWTEAFAGVFDVKSCHERLQVLGD